MVLDRESDIMASNVSQVRNLNMPLDRQSQILEEIPLNVFSINAPDSEHEASSEQEFNSDQVIEVSDTQSLV